MGLLTRTGMPPGIRPPPPIGRADERSHARVPPATTLCSRCPGPVLPKRVASHGEGREHGARDGASAHDPAASSSTDHTVTRDTIAPSVTSNQPAGQADPTNASTISFTVVFSEAVTGPGTVRRDEPRLHPEGPGRGLRARPAAELPQPRIRHHSTTARRQLGLKDPLQLPVGGTEPGRGTRDRASRRVQ
jgi:hypothetical protein